MYLKIIICPETYKDNHYVKFTYFILSKGLDWELEMHSLELTKHSTLPWQNDKTPFDHLLSENFGPVVSVKGPSESFMSVCWHINLQDNLGKLFTGCSFFSYYHMSLCFYSKSLSASIERRQGFADRELVCVWGGSQLNECKLCDQPVAGYWTGGFQDFAPVIIFACCIQSQSWKALEKQNGG